MQVLKNGQSPGPTDPFGNVTSWNSASFKPMESKGQLNNAAGANAPTTDTSAGADGIFGNSDDTTVSVNPSGFDSNFNGWDANHNSSFTDVNDLQNFASRANTQYNGTMQDNVKPFSLPDINKFNAYVPATTADQGQVGTDYNFDPASKTYSQVASGTGHYKKGFYNNPANAPANVGFFTIRDNHMYKYVPTGIVANPYTETDITATLPANTITESDGTSATGSVYDSREGGYRKSTNVDVAKLNSVVDGSGNSVFGPTYYPNGLQIFATRSDSWGSQIPNGNPSYTPYDSGGNDIAVQSNSGGKTPNGIRLQNASILPNAVTWVADTQVYIQGDYNTGKAAKFAETNPGSQVNAAGQHPTDWVDDTKRFSSAVMADAVNLLSNSWDNSKNSNTQPAAATHDFRYGGSQWNCSNGHGGRSLQRRAGKHAALP